MRLAFRRLVNLVPRRGLTLLGIDSPDAAALAALARSRVQTFGLAAGAEWRATDIRVGGGTTFRVSRGGQDLGEFTMALLGDHNVRNALAAIAIGATWVSTSSSCERGWPTFKGVKRRLEVVGEARGVTVYDDFAHHPTAVEETLRAVRHARPGRRIWAIFEPRSASSCRRVFQDDFARAFAGADEVVLASVFRSCLPAEERLSESRARRRSGAAERRARGTCRPSTRLSKPWPGGPRRGLIVDHVERRLRRHSSEVTGRVDTNEDSRPAAIRCCSSSSSRRSIRWSTSGRSCWRRRIRARAARGVRDVAPGYCTLGVHFDPLQTDLAALEHAIEVEFASVETVEAITDACGDRDSGAGTAATAGPI